MQTLKDRMWTEFKIAGVDRACWDKRGAVLEFRTISDMAEVARNVADKTQCDVIHLNDYTLLVENFE